MFNYAAQQVFVIHPFGAGGGIVNAIFSLSTTCAALDFKLTSLDQKIQTLSHQLEDNNYNHAHAYGFVNIGSKNWCNNLPTADLANVYIHKGHFYELTADNVQQELTRMPNKVAVAISLGSQCNKNLRKIRSNITTPFKNTIQTGFMPINGGCFLITLI
jgi:hypothetical protein